MDLIPILSLPQCRDGYSVENLRAASFQHSLNGKAANWQIYTRTNVLFHGTSWAIADQILLGEYLADHAVAKALQKPKTKPKTKGKVVNIVETNCI